MTGYVVPERPEPDICMLCGLEGWACLCNPLHPHRPPIPAERESADGTAHTRRARRKTMKNTEKRAAILVVISHLREQLAALPADESTNIEPDTEPSTSQDRTPFLGRPMTAKRGGACTVCGGSVQAGSPIVYNGTLKAIAHAACGRDDGRGGSW